MTAPRVSVVVPTRDRPDQLSRCLAALDAQTLMSFEIVVVDDASIDASAVAASVARVPRAVLVRGAGAGPAAARNLGADRARGQALCFTDDDCRPSPGWLEALVGGLDAGASVVAGPTRNGRPDDPFAAASQTITNHLAESSRDPAAAPTPFAPTSNLAVRADVFRAVRFDETFPLAAGEDREWCDRLAAAGHQLAFEPAAWVAHHQDLSWRRFWRQQVRYGRGAGRLRRDGAAGMQAPAFYLDLLRKGAAQGPRVGALVLLAQVATAVGIAREAVASRRR